MASPKFSRLFPNRSIGIDISPTAYRVMAKR